QANPRIIVTLQHRRTYHVQVIREDAPINGNTVTIGTVGLGTGTELVESTSRHGTGHEVELPAYENDVLHALAQTGGLPGTDAIDEIVIERPPFRTRPRDR